jgi:tetratricopeptide (TPR) repeat protein
MDWGQAIVRVIFWRRLRMARKIGDAAELIGQGKADETLRILKQIERRIPPYLGHLFFLTRGRAYDELGELQEAEQSYLAAVFAKEGASLAHLHLAVLCGRQEKYDETQAWIKRIRDDAEADGELLEQADSLETMVNDLRSGQRLADIQQRARDFSLSHQLDELSPQAALERLDQWVTEHPDQAAVECDELACYLGEMIVPSVQGGWKLNLRLEDSFVEGPRGSIHPFEVVRCRLHEDQTLNQLLSPQLGQ